MFGKLIKSESDIAAEARERHLIMCAKSESLLLCSKIPVFVSEFKPQVACHQMYFLSQP